MLKAALFVGLVCFGTFKAAAQDTISVMYYNLLKFPEEIPGRIADLRKIMSYSKPDILVVNELTSEAGANLILSEALNVYGVDHYEAAAYEDGPNTDNMLYYNAEKLGLLSHFQVPTGLRDISGYKLYYKHPDLSTESDTIYLHVYGMHLKAGSGYFDQRKDEALVLKYHLNDIGIPENIIAGGDFNFYSGNESGCAAMLEGADVPLNDPIDEIGNWNNNSFYADIHTQSTRTSSFGTGAGGGMDDRFDIIFLSNDALTNTNGLRYMAGSYKALGQDGDRFNESIIAPYNPTVPDSISEALYYMSDHLPVTLSLITDYTATNFAAKDKPLSLYYNATLNAIVLNKSIENGAFFLYSSTGQVIDHYNVQQYRQINLKKGLEKGIYFLTGRIGEKQVRYKFLVTH